MSTPPVSFARIAGVAARACGRYVVPFTALSIAALAPVWLLESRQTAGAIDIVHARGELALAFQVLFVLWVFQLALVAAVAPAVRAVIAAPAGRRPLGQFAAGRAGLRQLIRAIVPCGLAAACVMIAGIALVVPALIVLPLVALTGASRVLERPVPAAVLDSVRVARPRIVRVAAIVAGMLVLDLGLTLLAKRVCIHPLPAKPTMAQLLEFNTFLRVSIGALILISPLPAAALAATYELADASNATPGDASRAQPS